MRNLKLIIVLFLLFTTPSFGQVKNIGTHEQLLEKDALYKDMWEAHIGAQNWSASSKGRR